MVRFRLDFRMNLNLNSNSNQPAGFITENKHGNIVCTQCRCKAERCAMIKKCTTYVNLKYGNACIYLYIKKKVKGKQWTSTDTTESYLQICPIKVYETGAVVVR